MSLWTSSILGLFLLQTASPQDQPVNADSRPVAVEEAAAPAAPLSPAAELPRPLTFRKDWSLMQGYSDAYMILSKDNKCSGFYGGPRAATTVLNALVTHVKAEQLYREVSFQMGGKLQIVRDTSANVLYRLFDRITVNSVGSFYQRRSDPMRNIPADVGSFLPGSRVARVLILLHELGHLIQGENGEWLLPDDGFDGQKSRANSLRVEQICRAQLDELK
jgi:hypothetical protein